MKEVAYSVATWDSRDPTLGEFLDLLADFIRGLREIDPVFSELYVLGERTNRELRIDDDLGNLEELGLAEVELRAPESVFTNLDEGGRPTLTSRSPVGWILRLGTATRRRGVRKFQHLLLYLDTGGVRVNTPGVVKISVFDRNSPLLKPEVAERLFRHLVEFWNPNLAATSEEIFECRSGGFGWLNYNSHPFFERFLPERVHREALGKGVFYRLGDGRVLSKKDTEEVRAGLEILALFDKPETPPPFVVMMDAYSIYGELTPGELTGPLGGFISGLKEIDPVFSDFCGVKTKGKDELKEIDESSVDELGYVQALDGDAETWYTILDEDRQPASASHAPPWRIEYTMALKGQIRLSQLVYFSVEQSPEGLFRVSIQVRHRDSPLLEPELSERLFRHLVDSWDPTTACVTEFGFCKATGASTPIELLGSLNYRADPDFERYLPDRVHREPLGKGVFFRLGDGRVLFDKDTEEVRTGLAIQAAIENDAPPSE